MNTKIILILIRTYVLPSPVLTRLNFFFVFILQVSILTLVNDRQGTYQHALINFEVLNPTWIDEDKSTWPHLATSVFKKTMKVRPWLWSSISVSLRNNVHAICLMKLLDQGTFESTVVKSSDTSMIHCLKKYDSTSAFYFHLVHASTQSLKTQTQTSKTL